MTHRGEVWLVDFGEPVGREQSGRRPAVVVSADPLNHSRAGVVIVVPTTTTRRGLPSHVEIEPGSSGLDDPSYAKCEGVKSIPEQRLIARLGSVTDAVAFDIGRAVRFLFDRLPELRHAHVQWTLDRIVVRVLVLELRGFRRSADDADRAEGRCDAEQ